MENEITLKIKGMHCKSCVSKVKSSLESIENIENINVDLANHQASFNYNGEKPTDKNIRRAIDKVGFELIEIS